MHDKYTLTCTLHQAYSPLLHQLQSGTKFIMMRSIIPSSGRLSVWGPQEHLQLPNASWDWLIFEHLDGGRASAICECFFYCACLHALQSPPSVLCLQWHTWHPWLPHTNTQIINRSRVFVFIQEVDSSSFSCDMNFFLWEILIDVSPQLPVRVFRITHRLKNLKFY